MKAVMCRRYGPTDVLKIGEMEKPIPSGDEILISIAATTATLGDCEIRALALPLAFRLPIRFYLGFRKSRGVTLGQEFSGTVGEAGSGVGRFAAGDEVFGQTGPGMGAYAQYIAVKEGAP